MADKIGRGTVLNAIGDEDREFWSSARERSSTPVSSAQVG